MAKGQKKSNREIRKPKAEKAPKQNASNPSLKPGGIKGLENMKNGCGSTARRWTRSASWSMPTPAR